MRESIILKAWAAIGENTPLDTDCGAICGAACCKSDGDGQGGVCLLPGERALLGDVDWGEIVWDEQMGAEMLLCSGPCRRSRRPFLCRIFPLCPVVGRDGSWTVRMDARARAACPLTRSGLRGLSPAFIRAAQQAARLLAEDKACRDFLTQWAKIEKEFRTPLF